MKKVLLTIEGMTPDQKAFQYAVALCRRIRAELDIFQIIRPRYYRDYMKKVQKKTFIARKFVQSSMLATTFAEAGEHDTALDIMTEASKQIKEFLSESEKAGVRCRFSITSGNPEKEIVDYVNDHRDVVLTIYDASEQDAGRNAGISKKNKAIAKLKNNLSVPLVTVHR